MSNVTVRQPHSLPRAEARAKLAGFEGMLKKYGVSLAWKGDSATVSGIGVSGDIAVSDAAIDISLKLGMMAKMAGVDATKLQASIAKRLKEAYEG